MKKRTKAVIFFIAATTAAVIGAFAMGINPPVMFIIGAYAALLAGIIAAKLFRVTDGLFYTGLVFIFLASPVGSVLNLYRTFGPYDKIIHFFSGMLLAAFGLMVMRNLLMHLGISRNQLSKLSAVGVLFAFFFSSAGAGLWEIYEFVSDILSGGGMQRGMVDTLTDMIAGNLGGLTYAVLAYIGKGKNWVDK